MCRHRTKVLETQVKLMELRGWEPGHRQRKAKLRKDLREAQERMLRKRP